MKNNKLFDDYISNLISYEYRSEYKSCKYSSSPFCFQPSYDTPPRGTNIRAKDITV